MALISVTLNTSASSSSLDLLLTSSFQLLVKVGSIPVSHVKDATSGLYLSEGFETLILNSPVPLSFRVRVAELTDTCSLLLSLASPPIVNVIVVSPGFAYVTVHVVFAFTLSILTLLFSIIPFCLLSQLTLGSTVYPGSGVKSPLVKLPPAFTFPVDGLSTFPFITLTVTVYSLSVGVGGSFFGFKPQFELFFVLL